jgi:DNA-binding Lrp family transcriptional regulator
MIRLDVKDRKILYQLDLNSRQSANQLGRKVGLSRSVVNYRIKRLQNNGVIRTYYTLIDSMSVGFIPIRIHIKLQFTTTKKKQEIVDYFVKNRYSTLVASTYGFFNLSVVIDVREIHDFYDLWLEAKSKYGYYFQTYTLSFFINEMRFKSSYLLSDKTDNSEREEFIFINKRKIGKIDIIDLEILHSISSNAKISLLELANKLNLSSVAIKKRIEKLIKKGVILGFKININHEIIGYQKYKSYIQLGIYNKRKEIINYIKYNPNLINIDTNSGESDIELQFVLKDIFQLHDIMNDLINQFPNVIKDYDIITEVKLHKYIFFPECF